MSQISKKWIENSAIDGTKLDSTASFTMGALSVTGNTAVGGHLNVTGDSTFVGTVVFSGGTAETDSTVIGNEYVTGYVGIGTNNPTDRLVIGNGGIAINRTAGEPYLLGSIDYTSVYQIRGTSGGGLRITSGSSAAEWMRFSSTGHIGIGTTIPDPATSLHLYAGYNEVKTTYPSCAGFGISQDSSGFGNLRVYDNFGMIFATNNTERMRILPGGNVGIGTTIPQTLLQVRGAIQSLTDAGGIGSVGTGSMTVDADDTLYGDFVFVNGATTSTEPRLAIIRAVAQGATANERGGKLQIYTKQNGTTNMNRAVVIDNTGKVGIGTANPTLGKLQLVQTSDSATGGFNICNSTYSHAMYFFVDSNIAQINASSGGNESLSLNGSGIGKVGIGTTNPQVTLHIADAGNSGLRIDCTSGSAATGNANIDLKNDLGNYSTIGMSRSGLVSPNANSLIFRNNAAYGIIFQTNGSNTRMYIDAAGNVGIGTTIPGTILDVTGNDTASPIMHVINYSTSGGVVANFVQRSSGFTGDILNLGAYAPTSSNAFLRCQSASGTNYFLIRGDGNVGIGSSSPTHLLDMENGSGGYYSASDHQWHNGSTMAIKQDIGAMGFNPFDILSKVNVKQYRYRTEAAMDTEAPYHVGFIAEETPELLTGKDHNSMATGDCIGLLLACVKSLAAKVDELTAKLESR